MVISSRIRATSRVMSRETCIWLTPISLPISAWVQPRKNRISTISRSRRDSLASRGASVARASARSKPASTPPSRCPTVSSSSPRLGASSDAGAKQPVAPSASMTCSTSMPRWAAISLGRGARPSCWYSSLSQPEILDWVSWIDRGGRTVQPRSRKWRRISPRMVGTAKLTNSWPRSGLKPFTALTRPT